MIEELYRRKRNREFLKISLISGSISCLWVFLFYGGNKAEELYYSLFISLSTGFFTPLIVLKINDTLHYSRQLRKLNFLLFMLLEVFLLLAAITLVYYCSSSLVSFSSFLMTGMREPLIFDLKFALAFGTGMAVLFSFFGVLHEFLGKGFFKGLITGLYTTVREEDRIIVFVDLEGSTGIAEILSPSRFFDLLNDFFSVIETHCSYYGGTVYKYLGDGAILTWPTSGENTEKVFEMMTLLKEEMKERQPVFRERYGTEISFTAGVHSGPVLTGGLGTEKKELGYWGDILNTASRLQSACKQFGLSHLFSESFIRDLYAWKPELFSRYRLRRLRNARLRGKQGTFTLFTLDRSPLQKEPRHEQARYG